MITIENLKKFYRTKEVQTIGVSKFSFKVKEGEFAGIRHRRNHFPQQISGGQLLLTVGVQTKKQQFPIP